MSLVALSTRVSVSVQSTLTTLADMGVTPSAALNYLLSLKLATGTGVGQADRLYFKRRTLAASASEDLDLAGVLVDVYGAVITFARVKALLLAAVDTNANNVLVGAAAANPWVPLLNSSGVLTLRPGAVNLTLAGLADATGYAVTGGTGDLLKVANSGAGSSVSYDIAIIGASA